MILTIWKCIKTYPYFVPDKVIDSASAVIWCERFQEPGEFQFRIKATQELLHYFTDNELIITRAGTDYAMIPERIELTVSRENGNYLTVSGRSAESLAYRRIIMQDCTIQYPQNGAAMLYWLFQENISNHWYNYTDSDHPENQKYRHMPFFQVGTVTDLPDPENFDINAQPFCENLGEFTETICKACDDGYRVRFDKTEKKMFYEFYRGEDRSKTVIFSKDFQNLGDTVYSFDRRTYFNSVLVAGEGSGQDRVRHSARNEEIGSGLTLREKYVDAHSVSSNTKNENGEEITEVIYNILIKKMALTELYASKETISFDGEIVPGGQFKYRKDYFLGDKVTVQNELGIKGTATVTAVTESEDENGYIVVPEFSRWVV